jgi:hypothetical protein
MALRPGRFGSKAIRIDAADVGDLEPERLRSLR